MYRLSLVSLAGILLIVIGCVLFPACSKSGNSAANKEAAKAKYGSDTLKLYLPGEYMSDTLIPDFEKKFGVRVIVELFDSNEMMYAKVQAGDKYDVLIPSDYMIERLMKQKMLQPLDKSMLTNIDQLSDSVKKLSYDPDNTYSIPYFWGNVGMVYNKTKVDPKLIEEQGYSIYQNKDFAGRVYWYDSERDSFMIALKVLGYSMNSSDQKEIIDAYNWLIAMDEAVDPVYVTDEVIDSMKNGLKDIAIMYSGDAAYVLKENKNMAFITPKEGTNIWVDAMVIPDNAANPKLANEFINYVLSHDAAYGNSDAVGYTSANAEVLKEMTAPGATYADNPAYLPGVGYEKDEFLHDNDVINAMISELWMKVKAH